MEILQKYGAINAANLDGGTSTCMTVHSSFVNDPTTLSGDHRTRPVATAFILEADDSDDGDYSIVANKVDK
ncbi:MAG: phosphodiester glycosidase family protein [Clostridia bacterium]|nr:phosphodiester glycosidase family protein [Clostridia bacterium]